MANNVLSTVIQLKRGNAADWDLIKDSFIPAAGEACITLDGPYGGQVKFGNGTSTWAQLKYAGIVSTDGSSIQSDNGVISIKGYSSASQNQILRKGASGVEWVSLTPQMIGAVEKELSGTSGKSYIFNEIDGGGSKFEHTDGTESFVGVNNGGESGLVAQIYADKYIDNKWVGSRINVYHNGIYYVSKANQQSGYDRNHPDMEIATKKDIKDLGSALHFVGIATQQSGETEIQAVERTFPTAQQRSGAVAICGNKEFICYGTPLAWHEFGDVSAYATKAELEAEINRAQLAESNKLDLLVGDEHTGGNAYNLPYYFYTIAGVDKVEVHAKTVTLDGQKTYGDYSLEVKSATQSSAGLMNATDKSKLDNFYAKDLTQKSGDVLILDCN